MNDKREKIPWTATGRKKPASSKPAANPSDPKSNRSRAHTSARIDQGRWLQSFVIAKRQSSENELPWFNPASATSPVPENVPEYKKDRRPSFKPKIMRNWLILARVLTQQAKLRSRRTMEIMVHDLGAKGESFTIVEFGRHRGQRDDFANACRNVGINCAMIPRTNKVRLSYNPTGWSSKSVWNATAEAMAETLEQHNLRATVDYNRNR
ncbi:MAG TPA: hypothetical protein PLK80_00855 [bacterium]|nr:hypothetical protein [bacterium]HPI75256.1 hypothetical protein [bacterium]